MRIRTVLGVAFWSATLIHSQSSLDQGLVLHYSFNGQMADLSPSGNHANPHAGAVLTRDRFGNPDSALHLNGAGAYAQASAALPEMDSSTVSLWFALDSWMPSFGAPQIIFFEGDDGPGRDFTGYIMAGIHLNTKAEFTTRHLNWLPPIGTWVHLVCVADSANQTTTIWINGVPMADEFFPGGSNAGYHAQFNLGRRPGGYNDWFMAGQIDDVRVYNRALSPAEIGTLHHLERGPLKQIEIGVEQLRLTLNVTPGKTYLLQSSNDLHTWSNFGEPFTPTLARFQTTVGVTERGRFFRLIERL